ncbi:hypothetical protein D3C78_1026700 [compost metagenome]
MTTRYCATRSASRPEPEAGAVINQHAATFHPAFLRPPARRAGFLASVQATLSEQVVEADSNPPAIAHGKCLNYGRYSPA